MDNTLQYIRFLARQIGIENYDIQPDMVVIPDSGTTTDVCTEWIEGFYFPILQGFTATNLINNNTYAAIQFVGDCELFEYHKSQNVSNIGLPLFASYLRILSLGVPTDTQYIQVLKIIPKNVLK